jgi:hypothetical protein
MKNALILVTGSRAHGMTGAVLSQVLVYIDVMLLRGYNVSVMHGACPGDSSVDMVARKAALFYGLDELSRPAAWQNGRRAGPGRNQAMAAEARQMQDDGWDVVVLAFPWGESRGTRNMIKLAKAAGLNVLEHDMGLSNRFNRGAAAQKAPARTGKSRYSGIEASTGVGVPEPGYGDYILEIIKGCYERSKKTQGEYYEALLTVVESDGPDATPPGETVRFGQGVNIVGVKIIRDLMMAANGFDDLDAFNRFADATPDEEVEAIEDKRVAARCTRGGPKPEGGYYTEWQFAPAE